MILFRFPVDAADVWRAGDLHIVSLDLDFRDWLHLPAEHRDWMPFLSRCFLLNCMFLRFMYEDGDGSSSGTYLASMFPCVPPPLSPMSLQYASCTTYLICV